MPAQTIVGDDTVLWGADGVYNEGIIVSASTRLTGEKNEVPDSSGNTVAVIYFDEKDECQVEIIIKTSAPDLARGDAITIGGVVNCLVDDAEEVWSNTDVQRFRVNATRYANVSANTP